LRQTLGNTLHSDHIPMSLSDDLNFNVASVLTQLHQKDRRADNLVLHLNVCIAKICLVINETDTCEKMRLNWLAWLTDGDIMTLLL
jgi:hypothetical protein